MKNKINETSSVLKINNAVMLVFTTRAWGNRRKESTDHIEVNAEKTFFSVSKKLIDSPEYQEIRNYQMQVYSWINKHSVPSFFLRGTYLFNTDYVETVEEYLKAADEKLSELVQELAEKYEEKINDAKEKLGEFWNPKDYPEIKKVIDSFKFERKWVKFDVPQDLPKKVFKQEKEKAENMWKEAAEQISQCLRQSFVELIKHANEVLKPNSDGKIKGFKNASFEKIEEFIQTFKNRNIVDDKDLEQLVEQAKTILANIDNPQILKKDSEMRKFVAKEFKAITKQLDAMIETKPTRKFDFD